jgi:hypothetical protein
MPQLPPPVTWSAEGGSPHIMQLPDIRASCDATQMLGRLNRLIPKES